MRTCGAASRSPNGSRRRWRQARRSRWRRRSRPGSSASATAAGDAFNESLMNRLNESGALYLTHTRLDDQSRPSPRGRRRLDPAQTRRGGLGAHRGHGAGARGRRAPARKPPGRAMAICDLCALGGLLGAGRRAPDGARSLGAKTIGVAVSDVSRTIATARTTLRRSKLTRDIETLRAMIAADGIGGIVVGLPVNMDGSEGPRAQSARDTAARLADALALPRRPLGRAAFHRRRRAPPARRRSLAPQARAGRGSGGRRLHSAGRARPSPRGVVSDPFQLFAHMLGVPPTRHGRARPGHPRLVCAAKTKNVDARNKSGHDGIYG